MKIIYGRSGCGKTYFAMNEIKENIKGAYEGPLLYIVPEQFSLTAEVDLSKIIGRGGIIKAEVVTFKRLCHRIYNEHGFKKDTLDTAAKTMLLYYIMSKNENKLKVLNGVSKNLGLVTTVSDMISEFKRYNVTPEILKSFAPKSEYLKMKLDDLIFIYEAFEEKNQGSYMDKDDEYTKMSELIKNSDIVKGAKIWIDGFDGFTPQELNIINELEKVADVSILLTLDDTDNNMFLLNKKTYQKLSKENNVEPIYLSKQKRFNNIELKHLEENYNSTFIKKYEEKTKNIDIRIEKNPYEEIENIAIKILEKVRDENLRYENIAIVTRNIDSYKNNFKMIFTKYNIPYFFDDKHELSAQPLITLVSMLLDICTSNYSYESIFNYLKTGLTNVEDVNDIDRLENYVLEWGIKGNTWLKEWTFGKSDLEKINQIRRQVIEPIVEFKNKFSKQKKVSEIAKELYNFLIEIKAYENIQNKIKKLKEKENPSETEIEITNTYIQVWNIFIKLLDEIVMVLGEEVVSFDRFKNILKQGIMQNQIGILPTTRDHVVIGDVSRTRNSNIKVLFVIGLNDGVFPMPYNDEGFINDNERNELLDGEVEIAKDTKMLLLEENFNIYKVLTTPTDELHLSYPISDTDGKALRPSEVINSLKRIFPNIKISSDVIAKETLKEKVNTINSTVPNLLNDIREELDGESKSEEWKKIYLWFAENQKERISYIEEGLNYKNTIEYISKESANKLYGNEMNTSVSKLETYANCPFKYYLQYGLNAKERKVYKLDTPDVGIFLHEIIERFSNYLLERNISFRDIEKEKSDEIVSNIVDDVLVDFKSNIMTSTNKMKQLSLKLKKLIKRVIWTIVLQIKESDFEVVASELEFGKGKKVNAIEIELENGQKVLLSGKIDRVDIAKTEEGKYIRIIDYKSYSKEMKLFNVYSGLEVQLITYMDAVDELEAMPGGILYLKLDDPMIKTSKNIGGEEIEEQIRKSLRMNGMIVANTRLIKAMDTGMTSESNNLNLKISKEKYTGKTYVPTEEEFEKLRFHVRKTLRSLCEEILSGKIKNQPVKCKGKTPCAYCDYKVICQFDKKLGNDFKTLHEMKKEEIWEQLKLK